MKSLFFVILAVLFAIACGAQTSVLSDPIDISAEGWNKLVQVKNGNTLLFHFELRKAILVKVFDKSNKEIASKKLDTKLIDVNQLDNADFEGLFDIGGEAVLFAEQQVDNLHTLVRVRVDAVTGNMISEERVVRSASFYKETDSKVFKNADDAGYYVACFTHEKQDTISTIKLMALNEKHEVVYEVPYEINSRAYDYASLVNCGMDRLGNVLFCIELSKIIQYPDLNERTLMMLYAPKGERKFTSNKLTLPQKLKIASEDFTVNPFAGSINMFVDKAWDVTEVSGGKETKYQYITQALFILPEDMSGLHEAPLKQDTANAFLGVAKKDTALRYVGTVINKYTNDAGKTTVIFEDKTNIDEKTLLRNANTRCAGDICIARYDDAGKEMWSAILPKSHYYAPVRFYPVSFNRTSESELFTTLCLNSKKNCYILFNDPDENFAKALTDNYKPQYDYENTNAQYYAINKKNEVSKKYLVEPKQGTYRQMFPGSAYFDEAGNTVAVLIRQTISKTQTLHIAWSKLAE